MPSQEIDLTSISPTRLWVPKHVMITRSAADLPHTAEIIRRCERAGVDDIRFLPGQGPDEILAQMAEIPDCEVVRTLTRAPAYVSRHNPYVRALADAVGRSTAGESISVGRDGASDAISFLEAGIPAVEFGPSGAGHHGPEEWVSIASLRECRRALCHFVAGLPRWLSAGDGDASGAIERLDVLEPDGTA